MALTAREKLRLLIGDVDEDSPVLTDDQCDYFLGLTDDDARSCAADAANAAANILTMQAVDETTGAMSVTLTRRAELYRQRAIDLGGAVGVGSLAGVYVGGILQSEIDASREDSSLPARAFATDLHDDPGSDDAESDDS